MGCLFLALGLVRLKGIMSYLINKILTLKSISKIIVANIEMNYEFIFAHEELTL